MEAKRTDRYTEEELEDEEYEELDEKKDKKNKNKTKTKRKTSHKTKKSKPKKKVVHKKEKSGSGFFTFFLIIVILVLIAVTGYLLYTSYYKEDSSSKTNSPKETEEKICEAKATKYNIESGLNKCEDSSNFKLIITGTKLAFDITRGSNNLYTINNVYYDNNPISTSLTGKTVTNKWELKTDGDANYLLIEVGDSNIFTVITSEGSIYNGTENTTYKLGFDVSYTRYTSLGLEDVNTCDYYEENNLSDEVLYTEGTLVYNNGQVTEEEENEVMAKDVCK